MDMYGIVTDGCHWVFLKLNSAGDAFGRSREIVLQFAGDDLATSAVVLFQWLHAIISKQVQGVEQALQEEEELQASGAQSSPKRGKFCGNRE